MNELIPFPFCGWENVKIQKRERRYYWMESPVAEIRIDDAAYYAACNRCHARGGVATGKFVGCVNTFKFTDPIEGPEIDVPIPEWTTTREEVEKAAADLWNKRAVK